MFELQVFTSQFADSVRLVRDFPDVQFVLLHVGMLEDLIVAAINDARTKVDQRMSDEMAKVTGGMPLPPGFKL